MSKVDKKAEAAEQKAIDAASAALTKALDAAKDKEDKDKDNDPAVRRARQSLDRLKGARRNRQFPLLVAAYQATSAVSRAVEVATFSWALTRQTVGHRSISLCVCGNVLV